MSYSVKEIFYTLQGEGAQAGRPAVFCRFSGCNLWSGREADRATAVCQFCDTDFVGTDGTAGGRYATPHDLAQAIETQWLGEPATGRRFVVCTGGEPLLQLDPVLIAALHDLHFEIAVETNGTIAAPEGPHQIDWLCVSPKAGAPLVQLTGSELKLVFPQPSLMPESVQHLRFAHYFLQPMDGPDQARNTELAIQYCLDHPQWRLSVQSHKLVGIR